LADVGFAQSLAGNRNTITAFLTDTDFITKKTKRLTSEFI